MVMLPQECSQRSVEEMMDAPVVSNSAPPPAPGVWGASLTTESGGLSIQTAGTPHCPCAHDDLSGSLQCLRDRAGLEEWWWWWGGEKEEMGFAPPTPCWVPRGSDKAFERLEQVVVEEIPEGIMDIPRERATENEQSAGPCRMSWTRPWR